MVIFGSANPQEKALTANHELALLSFDGRFNYLISEFIDHLGETMGVNIFDIAQDRFPPTVFERIKKKFFRKEEEIKKEEKKEEKYPNCGNVLLIRESKYGKFYGCSKFPSCRYNRSIEQKR